MSRWRCCEDHGWTGRPTRTGALPAAPLPTTSAAPLIAVVRRSSSATTYTATWCSERRVPRLLARPPRARAPRCGLSAGLTSVPPGAPDRAIAATSSGGGRRGSASEAGEAFLATNNDQPAGPPCAHWAPTFPRCRSSLPDALTAYVVPAERPDVTLDVQVDVDDRPLSCRLLTSLVHRVHPTRAPAEPPSRVRAHRVLSFLLCGRHLHDARARTGHRITLADVVSGPPLHDFDDADRCS